MNKFSPRLQLSEPRFFLDWLLVCFIHIGYCSTYLHGAFLDWSLARTFRRFWASFSFLDGCLPFLRIFWWTCGRQPRQDGAVSRRLLYRLRDDPTPALLLLDALVKSIWWTRVRDRTREWSVCAKRVCCWCFHGRGTCNWGFPMVHVAAYSELIQCAIYTNNLWMWGTASWFVATLISKN